MADDLGDVLWAALPPPPVEKSEIIDRLKELRESEEQAREPTGKIAYREASRGFRFSHRGSIFVVEHERLTSSAVSAIEADMAEDQPARRFRLMPETLKKEMRNPPSWNDWVLLLRQAGFESIEFTNGTRVWQVQLESGQSIK